MAKPVEMPQLGNTVEECLLTKWLKQEGDVVSAGDMIAEIETDKTTFEVTAPIDGTVLATFFEEGALVPEFTTIFVVGEPGEAIEQCRPGARAAAPVETPAAAAPAVASAPAIERGTAAASPRAAKLAVAHHIDPATLA